jgi:hypothetical protein
MEPDWRIFPSADDKIILIGRVCPGAASVLCELTWGTRQAAYFNGFRNATTNVEWGCPNSRVLCEKWEGSSELEASWRRE